jgi:integrase
MGKQTGVLKLSNGRFRARYFAGYDSKGKRQYPAKTFDTQSEAIKWRAERISAKGPGSLDGHGVTVALYLDQWLVTKHALRENSRRMYQQSIDAYVKPGLGHIRLTRLTASQIEQWQAELLNRVSASTVASARTLLFGALKKATGMNLMRSNPVEATDGPGRGKPERYPLSVEEALRFVSACVGSRFGLLFELMLSTGLRPEEAIGLCWSDLELNSRGVVRVRRVVHHLATGGWRWHEPKTKNSERAIVFSGDLAAKLSDHRKAQLQQKLKVGQHWKNNDLVFTTLMGEPVRYCVLQKEFRTIVDNAQLPKAITIYTLRHAFVTFSLIAGVDAKTVSREAGHATVSFTLDRYGHVLEEMHESAADKREGLLKSRAIN